MKLSTQTDNFSKLYGDHDAIQMLARIGYDALDYSMFGLAKTDHPLVKEDYKEYAASLKRTADENNIFFNQSHAPFPVYKNGDELFNEKMIDVTIRALEITSIVGGEIMIVHPYTLRKEDNYDKQKEINMNLYNRLLPYCKKFNVKIALENMWEWDSENKRVKKAACSTAEEFTDYLDSLDKDYFTACVDIGHGEMEGAGSSSAELIRTLGHDRLKSLHVHDNDKVSDLHMMPYAGKINWEEITSALKEINYDGILTLEADNYLRKFPKELCVNAARLMHDVGRFLALKLEE